MSITRIEVRSSRGELLNLPLNDPTTGYVVEDVDGLDPVKASIASSNFANLDGQQYQSSRLDVRNIVMTLSYLPDWSNNENVRILRTRLYRFFMVESEVSLRIYMQDGLVVNISGRVESFENPLFSQEPKAVISIICFNPDFVQNGLTTRTDFLTTDTVDRDIEIVGSVPNGVTFSMRAYAPFNEFTIYHTTPNNVLRTMQFAVPLINNDLVRISTTPGSKSVTLVRGTTESSILYSKSPQSEWVTLEPGVNKLRVYATPTTASPVFVNYYNRYGGL